VGIVTVGKDLILDRLNGTGTAINSMGVGTDSTAFAAAQIKLNPTVAGSVLLQALDATFPTRSAETATYQSTFATGSANFAINEIGLFNGVTNGTSIMLNRIVLGGTINKTSAISIVFVVTLTQA
jgi:hypothetical protein